MSKKNQKTARRLSAKELKRTVERFIKRYGLNLCLECGKCSSVCPMLNLYGEYLYDRCPRGVVERMSFESDRLEDEALWYCLTCDECSFFCPSGVDFKNFMMALRDYLIEHGLRGFAVFCPQCGVYLMPKKEFEHLVKDSGHIKTKDLLAECARCKQKRYTETLRRMAPVNRKGSSSAFNRNERS